METIIVFFRDTLSGTLYVVVSIVCVILIGVCIWQLIRRNKKVKESEEKFASSHIVMINEKGEEETIEFASSSTTVQKNSIVSNVDVVSSTKVLNTSVNSNNVSTSNSMGINSDVSTGSSSKPVVTINPMEVAAVSSTMNVIGATSAQKVAIENSNPDNKLNSVTESAEAISSVDSGVKIIDSKSVSSVAGTTNVVDPASIASTVGTTTVVGVDLSSSASNIKQSDNQNFTN